jgi:hypothetical protein
MSKGRNSRAKKASGSRGRGAPATRGGGVRSADGSRSSGGPVLAPTRIRRSRRVVRHVDTRSVLKFSAFFYLTLVCIAFVAGIVLWLAATAVGVRENVERFIGELIASSKFHFVGWEVLRVSAVAAAVIVVLGTAFNVFLAVVYNLIAEIVGGMAIIVDDEQPASMAADGAPSVPILPASEITGFRTGSRSHDDAPVPAAQAGQDDERAVARWVPKRGHQT